MGWGGRGGRGVEGIVEKRSQSKGLVGERLYSEGLVKYRGGGVVAVRLWVVAVVSIVVVVWLTSASPLGSSRSRLER